MMRRVCACCGSLRCEPCSGYGAQPGRRRWTGQGCNGGLARTGDTQQRARATKGKAPFALVTTPESLSLILTDVERAAQLAGVIARSSWTSGMNSSAQTWRADGALSARLRTESGAAHLGTVRHYWQSGPGHAFSSGSRAPEGVMIHGKDRKKIEVETLMPEDVTFPRADTSA